MLDLQYEALVGDLEGESRRLIAFLGLDWEPACLDFHRTKRPVRTASAWQVRQGFITARSGGGAITNAIWRHCSTRSANPKCRVRPPPAADPALAKAAVAVSLSPRACEGEGTCPGEASASPSG